jgi:1,4-dihydroxy-2-naphthoate octaprenyltransferase
VGKNQLIVKLGLKKAVKGDGLLLTAVYLSIIIGVLTNKMPYLSIISLITILQARKALKILKEHKSNLEKMLGANIITLNLHLQTGLLLSLAYFLSSFFCMIISKE